MQCRPDATTWHFSSMSGAAVPLFEKACEGRLEKTVFLQQRRGTHYGLHEGTFHLVVRSCKERSLESMTDFTETDRTARYVVALCTVASTPLYTTAALLASGLP